MLMFDFLSLINIISILRIHSVYSIFYPYLLPLFLCPISFLLFQCASAWENTRARVPLSYSHSHTEWYHSMMVLTFFPTVQLRVHNENSVRCGRNTDAQVNLNTKLN